MSKILFYKNIFLKDIYNKLFCHKIQIKKKKTLNCEEKLVILLNIIL